MERYYQLNCLLRIVNVANVLALLGLLIYDAIVHDPISNGSVTVVCTILDLIYLLTWSFSLYQVFSKFKASDKLLPEKKVFILHAILMIVYVVGNLLTMLLDYMPALLTNCDATCRYSYYSLSNVFLLVCNIAESSTFIYVVKLMTCST